jgi:hypothetical protein
VLKKVYTTLLLLALMSLLVVPATQAQAKNGDDNISGEGWSVSGDVPTEVIPTKWENGEADDESSIVPEGGWMFNASGVLSAARYEDAEANESAVWSGAGDVQELLENDTAELILPESGYMMVTGAGFDVTCGDYTVSLEAEEDHSWFLVLRGRADGRGDRNVVCEFSNYTAGAVLVTMYAIPVDASAFFSEGYLEDNMDNARVRKNCGATGCDFTSVMALDVNDGAVGVWTHDDNGFELDVTNAVMP